MAYRLGWVLYWACLVLILALQWTFGNLPIRPCIGGAVTTSLRLGRAFRYVLSGE
jgi:hypothetical protein